MSAALLLLLALSSPPQDAVPQAGPPSGQEVPLPSDWVVAVVGDELVLFSDLQMTLLADRELAERARALLEAGDDPGYELLLSEAMSDRLETLMRVQAGHDLGYDPELVEELTEQNFQSQVEAMGGPKAAAAEFKAGSVSPARYKATIRDRMLEESWRRSVTGTAAGATGRTTVDRYVRPGILFSTYETFCNSPDPTERAFVGLLGERVGLQVLHVDVSPESEEEKEAKFQLITELRRLYVAGEETFDNLVGMHGSPVTQKPNDKIPPREIFRLAHAGEIWHESAALGELARDGEVGEVSAPLWRETPPTGWSIYRVDQRVPPTEAQPFVDRGLQVELEERVQRTRDGLRERAAFEEVLEATYLWPEEFRRILRARRARSVN